MVQSQFATTLKHEVIFFLLCQLYPFFGYYLSLIVDTDKHLITYMCHIHINSILLNVCQTISLKASTISNVCILIINNPNTTFHFEIFQPQQIPKCSL